MEELRGRAEEPADAVSRWEAVLGGLLTVTHRLHPERLATVVAEHVEALGVGDVRIYLVDINQRLLVPLPVAGRPDATDLEIDTTLAGRAFRSEQPLEGSAQATDAQGPAGAPGAGTRRLYVPVLDGAERLGVIAISTDRTDPVHLRRYRQLASLVGELVVSRLPYGDFLVRARRRREMDLAAELRWAMLPPLTYMNDRVAVSGILEPAYEIAGDSFDYAVNGDLAQVAIIDAMGHGLEASRIANLAVGAYRNARRRDLRLVEAFRYVDAVTAEQFGPEKFVTGQLGELDTATGALRWLNAGHPSPMLLRGGSHLLDLPGEVCLPIGLGDVPTEEATVALEPGDSVLFFTDGVTEARSPEGELFGRERLGDLFVRAASAGVTPAELMRRLCHAVLAHQRSQLQDDATLVVIRWAGPVSRG